MEGRSLFVTDVDNTVLGDDDGLARFADWFSKVRDRVKLVYNSGRFVASVFESVESTGLPGPDAIIGGVGTEIGFAEDSFKRRPWAPHEGDWDAELVRGALDEIVELELQPAHLLSPLKVSYYAYDADEGLLQRIRQHLASAGLNVQLIYSSKRDLDILPASAGKGQATARLAEHWDYAPEQVIVSGDSGNDLAMLQQGFRGIVVANAHEELLALSGANFYHAQASFAGGVLEGLQHWLQM